MITLSGRFIFEQDQQTVWNLLMNPQAIANVLPGVDELIPIEGEENAWRAEMKIGVASVGGTYSGTMHLSELDPPQQCRITVSGEGQQTTLNGTALVKLSPDPKTNKTLLTWQAEANIEGQIARVGQPTIKLAANFLSKLFFQALDRQANL